MAHGAHEASPVCTFCARPGTMLNTLFATTWRNGSVAWKPWVRQQSNGGGCIMHVAVPNTRYGRHIGPEGADQSRYAEAQGRKTLLKKIFGLGILVLAFAAGPLSAQTTREWDPAGLQMTRAELQDLLARYQATANSDAYSGPVKEQAREEAELIRQRLDEGDIRAGDRIMMSVEGQPTLSDTFTVMGTRAIILPQLGEISLAGILRSELQTHLTTELSRYIINPVVHARSLIRLGILGAVMRPGYYTVPSDMLFTDALMVAGGPSAAADLEKMTVQRGDKTIWSKSTLRQAVQEGRTLDQMSIRAGDNVDLPIRREGTARLTNILVVVSGLTSLIVVARQLGIF